MQAAASASRSTAPVTRSVSRAPELAKTRWFCCLSHFVTGCGWIQARKCAFPCAFSILAPSRSKMRRSLSLRSIRQRPFLRTLPPFPASIPAVSWTSQASLPCDSRPAAETSHLRGSISGSSTMAIANRLRQSTYWWRWIDCPRQLLTGFSTGARSRCRFFVKKGIKAAEAPSPGPSRKAKAMAMADWGLEEQKQLEWTGAKERTSVIRLAADTPPGTEIPLLLDNESWGFTFTPDMRYGKERLYQAFQLHRHHLHHLKLVVSGDTSREARAMPDR